MQLKEGSKSSERLQPTFYFCTESNNLCIKFVLFDFF